MTTNGNLSDASSKKLLLCLTVCGYRKPGMTEEAYRQHLTQVTAPMTQGLMVKYGIVRWTQIHNTSSTRALMGEIFDPQFANVADYDSFIQAVFRDIEDYKRLKQDPWYQTHLIGDHEKFADTKRSRITIGWVEEFIKDGKIVEA